MSRLDDIKQDAAAVLIQYSNGYVDARLNGTGKEDEIFDHMLRLHYLYYIVDSAFENGGVYIGDTEITDIEEVYAKIHHYNGFFLDVDLSTYEEIVEDDGDGGSTDPSNPTEDTDHYRSGNLAVTVGVNPVTFIKDGIASPLASADYTVEAWVIAASGQRQNNVVVSTQTAGGFIASDVLKSGTLYYIATLNT